MFVCLCKGVSDKQIRKLLEEGAVTLKDVMCASDAGRDCGSCVCDIKQMLLDLRGNGDTHSA